MSWVTKASLDRIEKLGMTADNKCFRCNAPLMISGTGRSIWVRPFDGGFGEVMLVGEVYCPKCDSAPEPPGYGTPIYEDEIVELS